MIRLPEPEHRRAILMLILANLYWGISFPVIKAITVLNGRLVPGAGSWFATSAAVAPRFVLAVALLTVFRGRLPVSLTRLELRQGLAIGLFAAMGTLLQTDGMQFTDASTSAFLTQFSAILIPAWLALRQRHDPGPLVWGCCALVLAGVAILGHFDWHTLRFGRGEWETLLCSVFFVGQILWVGRSEFAANRPGEVTLVMFAVQAAVFVALAVATAPHLHDLAVPWASPGWLGLTLTLTVVCTIGAFSLMTRWQPRISATEAGLIYCIEPVFASVFAVFVPQLLSDWTGIAYPNERLTWSLVIGGGLIIIANALIQLRRHQANEAV
jgi:drug/metabolite transporter (DMT)-like permease